MKAGSKGERTRRSTSKVPAADGANQPGATVADVATKASESKPKVTDKAAAKPAAAPKAAAEKPAAQAKPAAEKPAAQAKPAAEKPAAQAKPAVEKPAAQAKPVAEKPVAQAKPVAAKPAPAAKSTEAEKPATAAKPAAAAAKPAPAVKAVGPVEVKLPIRNWAAEPLDEAFQISVDTPTGTSQFRGRIVTIFYGFTPKSKEEYLANTDVPWFNREGAPAAAGAFEVTHERQGAKLELAPLAVAVPAGMNLVFRLRFKKFSGGEPGDAASPPRYEGEAETMTYFTEVK